MSSEDTRTRAPFSAWQAMLADSHWQLMRQQLQADGLHLARVTAAYGEESVINTGDVEVSAQLSGALRYDLEHRSSQPVTGDWVGVRLVDRDLALIERLLPRRSAISRRAAGSRHDEQVLAANIDAVFIACGLDGDFQPRRIERYLALANEAQVQAVIILTKRDLCDDLPARLAELRDIAAAVPLIAISALRREGLDQLQRWLAPGRTVALLGSSGAGKSTLVNALLGEDRQRTSAVRQHDDRGRHTTTARELICLPSGAALIDTPGLREIQLWASADSVDAVFDEIATLSADCRYRDCQHHSEPGCAVLAAVDRGELDQARWQAWRKLRKEAAYHERAADQVAASLEKQRWKAIHKAMRHFKK